MDFYGPRFCVVDWQHHYFSRAGDELMKKAKTLEVKLRSALRLIWSRSKEHRDVIKLVTVVRLNGVKEFLCPICQRFWPVQMADVDHEPPIGELVSWEETTDFIRRMFFGPQRAICKLCHKTKTAAQRRKGTKNVR